MPKPYDKSKYSPWGLFRSNDIFWLGMAEDESAAWDIGLGWPSQSEIDSAKIEGIYAAPADIRPRKTAAKAESD